MEFSRSGKNVLCFMEGWENCGNSSMLACVPAAFLDLPNFHLCFQSTGFPLFKCILKLKMFKKTTMPIEQQKTLIQGGK